MTSHFFSFKINQVVSHGGVAQLVERSVRIREVKGSNPSVSTKSTAILIQSVSRLRCLIFAYFTDFFIFFIHSTKDKSLP